MIRNINYYMALPYPMEITEDTEEGGFTVSFPDLPGCLTCAETVEEAVELAKDAKRCWLETALKDGIEITEPVNGYSGQFRLRMPKELHGKLAREARRQGVSMNMYCVYLLSERSGNTAK